MKVIFSLCTFLLLTSCFDEYSSSCKSLRNSINKKTVSETLVDWVDLNIVDNQRKVKSLGLVGMMWPSYAVFHNHDFDFELVGLDKEKAQIGVVGAKLNEPISNSRSVFFGDKKGMGYLVSTNAESDDLGVSNEFIVKSLGRVSVICRLRD